MIEGKRALNPSRLRTRGSSSMQVAFNFVESVAYGYDPGRQSLDIQMLSAIAAAVPPIAVTADFRWAPSALQTFEIQDAPHWRSRSTRLGGSA